MNALRQARPQRWLILVAAIVCVALTASLGIWQLQRASYKEHLAAQIAQRQSLPVLTNAAFNSPAFTAHAQAQESWLQRPALLRGRWLHEETTFLDNRPMRVAGSQRVGFYVVTPLALEGGSQVMWVQRGWVQRDFLDRTKLPDLPKSSQMVTVPGRLIAQASRAYDMQAAQEPTANAAQPDNTATAATAATAGARPSRIWQNLPVLTFAGKDALPFALLQTQAEAQDAGSARVAEQAVLLRDWPAPDSGVAKHYGYAFQWFALCALFIGLYVWFQLIAPRRRRPA